MTTRDNQTFRISITMTTQTPAGIDWRGEAEVSGPYDDGMLDQIVALSDQLAEKAMAQRDINHDGRIATIEESIAALPDRPRKKRSKLETSNLDRVDAGADFLAQPTSTSDLTEVESPQTLAPLSQETVINSSLQDLEEGADDGMLSPW